VRGEMSKQPKIDFNKLDKKEKLRIRKEAYKIWALSIDSAKNKKQPFQAVSSNTGLSLEQVEKLYIKDNWESRYNKDIESGTIDKMIDDEKRKAIETIPNKENVAESIDELLTQSDLKDRQKMFICYYLQNFNVTQAAMNAGYSKSSAINEGSKMMNNPKIRRVIDNAKKIMAYEVNIDAKQLIEEYIRIAFADMTEFVEFDGRRVKLKDSDKIDGRLITEVKQGKDGVTVKLMDKKWAMDKLEKLLDYMPDKKIQLETKKLDLQTKLLEKQLQSEGGDGTGNVIIVKGWD
jgi:phage terminase small subunit